MTKQYVIYNETEERYELIEALERGFVQGAYAGEELYELLEDAQVQVDDYRAKAVDRDGVEHEVVWDIDEVYMARVHAGEIDFDGSDACNWKYPSSVKEI